MTVTDFHAHILPTLDHGCQDMSECEKQLRLIDQSQTNVAVATPHFYPHINKVTRFNSRIDAALSQIKASDISLELKLAIGAEILLYENMDTMEDLSSLCIRGTKILLIELPMHSLKSRHFDTVEAMLDNGYTVLLAHIDRYFKVCPDDIDTLLSMGAIAQINADSLTSRSKLKRITKYLDKQKVWALGSDIHGTIEADYSAFVKSSKLLGEYYESIMLHSDELLAEADLIELK